jgi:hypothetical protein
MSTLAWSSDLRSTFQLFKNENAKQVESLSKLNAKEKLLLMSSIADQPLDSKSLKATVQNIWV